MKPGLVGGERERRWFGDGERTEEVPENAGRCSGWGMTICRATWNI